MTNLKISRNEEYRKVLDDIRYLLDKAKSQAYKAVDNIRVQTYWQIGERLVREEIKNKNRADYGLKIIEKISDDLGFNKRELYRIVQFYKSYPILSQVATQLSWSHYLELIIIVDENERRFYEKMSILNLWGRNELRKQISDELYHNNKNTRKILSQAAAQSLSHQSIFKDTYNFEFLQLPDNFTEKHLEDSLMKNAEKLLLELGTDFSLSGRQKKIIIDGQIHNIDLEFYHRGVPCMVLVELKIGPFKSMYAGQMNKYLNFYRENKKYHWEKDPVGIIICENLGSEEVHYALGNITNKIFVADYKTKLPDKNLIIKKLGQLKFNKK